MSTAIELSKKMESGDFTKSLEDTKSSLAQLHLHDGSASADSKSQQHPLHQYDLTKMAKFYEQCVAKLAEQSPKWKPAEWAKATPMPSHLSADEQKRWPNPVVLSEKQRVYERFAQLARDLGEPMCLLPGFDLADLESFELFLDALKTEGVGAMRKYKQYLANKDMRKQEVDLVCVHARYGVIIVETKEGDYVDYKRKSRAKMLVGKAKSVLKALGRLIAEAKGQDAPLPVLEFVALPKVQERPQPKPQHQQINKKPEGEQQEKKEGAEEEKEKAKVASSSSSIGSRQLGYLVKADLESQAEFAKWWAKSVVEPRLEQEKLLEEKEKEKEKEGQQPKKSSKFDSSMLSQLVSLISCIRNNSVLPVVYPTSEDGTIIDLPPSKDSADKKKESSSEEKDKEKEESLQFQPALNIHAEFLRPKHEEARSLSKCLVVSRDSEKIRKTICLQTLWLLLNDSQKKISVVCSELNKPYYEEFLARQRKVYTALNNNVRLYTDLHSCGDPALYQQQPHTLRKDGEIWLFDAGADVPSHAASLSDIIERAKWMNAYWVFSSDPDQARQHKDKLCGDSKDNKDSQPPAKWIDLDEDKSEATTSIKLPLRLQCDLLIIGDMISTNQVKYVYNCLKSKAVPSQASHYYQPGQQHHHHQGQQAPMQQLNFNPAKKFRSVKFIRGGSIDNIRTQLKMHDSVSAQCVVLHVGDEDLFKTRFASSASALDRIKELATLTKEYCPKSFVVLSTLMRRMSRTENQAAAEVNKGLVAFCKQTRDTPLACFYMHNGHLEPEYHTQGGRLLNNKGLKLYMDNVLFVVDYFLVKNNKQH